MAFINTIFNQTYIDLFAGCGGLSLGLHAAGWEGLFAIERDPMAFETLERNMLAPDAPYPSFKNWPEWLPKQNYDIDTLLSNDRFKDHLRSLQGHISLIAGGPPCQGFSVGGMRDGSDIRNQLAHRMLEIVKLVRPSMVLIENVEGITRPFRSKPGATKSSVADNIIDTLRTIGYDASFTKVDASRFGVPQYRHRVFILGISNDLPFSHDLSKQLQEAMEHVRIGMLKKLGLPLDRTINVREAIEDLSGKNRVPCPDSPKFLSGTYTDATSSYAQLLRHSIPNTEIPNSHRFSYHGARIHKLYALAHETQPHGRLSKEFLLNCGTKKDKKVLLDPEAPVSTITTHPDEFIHYSEPRNISVREMARLQSFPDNFDFYGRYTINGPRRHLDVARCSQVGNAVPPYLGQAVGLALIELLSAANGHNTEFHYKPEAKKHKDYLQQKLFADSVPVC